jgi:hypothetical protein
MYLRRDTEASHCKKNPSGPHYDFRATHAGSADTQTQVNYAEEQKNPRQRNCDIEKIKACAGGKPEAEKSDTPRDADWHRKQEIQTEQREGATPCL